MDLMRMTEGRVTDDKLDRVDSAIKELIGDPDGEEDVVFTIDTERFLVIKDNNAYLMDVGDAAEVTFLGELFGGRYKEKMALAKYGLNITMCFEHERLPNAIEEELHVIKAPDVSPSTDEDRRRARAQRMREHFRRWGLAERPR